MKPTFLVIGAMKCGTSSLSEMLDRHPEVFLCKPREPEFFCRDELYLKRGWSWYESLYQGASGAKAIGEGSTSYTKLSQYPDTAGRIARDLPDARIIYITRDPLRRIESHWMHNCAMGRAPSNFCRVIRKDPRYVDASLYWKQINAYRDYFPDDQILVLFFEDFVSDHGRRLGRCLEFIGVDPALEPSEEVQHRNKSIGRIRRSRLQRIMANVGPVRWLASAVPAWVAGGARRLLEREVTGRPAWDPDTRVWAISQVAEDAAAFLRFYGKPSDFWRFDSTPSLRTVKSSG